MAQTDFFLKIPGLDGESEDATYKNCIDVESWSWGMTQSGSMHIAGGGGKGKVSIHDLSVTKNVDKASPALMQKCCDGEHLAEATLILHPQFCEGERGIHASGCQGCSGWR
jgi:type VI secretion system secreted protein Hcp